MCYLKLGDLSIWNFQARENCIPAYTLYVVSEWLVPYTKCLTCPLDCLRLVSSNQIHSSGLDSSHHSVWLVYSTAPDVNSNFTALMYKIKRGCSTLGKPIVGVVNRAEMFLGAVCSRTTNSSKTSKFGLTLQTCEIEEQLLWIKITLASDRHLLTSLQVA